MKKALLLILLIVCSLTYDMYSTVLVVGGCTRPHNYRFVKHADGKYTCEGHGWLVCFESDQVLYSPTHKSYNLLTVYEFVVAQVIGGVSVGELKYEDDLPLKWKNENDVLTLEIGDVEN